MGNTPFNSIEERQLQAAYTGVPVVGPDAKNVTTINFVDDGLAAFGKMWYRGEELSVDRDSVSFQATQDTSGESWLDLDEDAQIARWGKRMFRPGKWSGAGFDLTAVDVDGQPYTEEDQKILAELNAKTEAVAKKTTAAKRSV